jgi:sugar O-acyltransferase (sialic acid O-acetyltransferase NeuD family)
MIVVYGASGHGKVVAAAAASVGLEIAYFLDDDQSIISFQGFEVVHKKSDPLPLFIAIGSNRIRKEVVAAHPSHFSEAIVDFTATIRSSQPLGKGSLVAATAVINPDAHIGAHVIVNTAAVIEHDCILEDFVHISPHATLSGNVFVGEGTHIGAGAVAIPGIRIGKWCTIGAGTVLIKDVPDFATVVGNPGRVIRIDE